MTGPAFMWRMAFGTEVVHYMVWDTLAVERRKTLRDTDARVLVAEYPTIGAARGAVLRSTERYENYGLKLSSMYVIKDPRSIEGLDTELLLLLVAYKGFDPRLDDRVTTAINVFVVGGVPLLHT